MSTKKAIVYFLLATFMWGLSFVFIKNALTSVEPFTFIFYRFMLGAVFLILINKGALKKINLALIKKSLVLSLLLFGTVLFQTIGLKTVNASTASFITGTAIVYVVVLTAIYSRKCPAFRNLIAVCLALTGLGFVTLHHSADQFTLDIHYVSVVLCSICFGFYIFFAKKIIHESPVVPLTILQALMIAVFSVMAVVCTHSSLRLPTDLNAIVGILYCGIFASGFAFTLQLKSQKTLSAQKASVLFAMEPIFATVAAVFMLHEQLSYFFLVGSFLILSSIIIIE